MTDASDLRITALIISQVYEHIAQAFYWKGLRQDFPGGAVVKNLPAKAGDMGSNPGPGRSHMPRSNEAHAPQLQSLLSRACEPQLLSPRATTTEARVPRSCAPWQEKPVQWRVAPARHN